MESAFSSAEAFMRPKLPGFLYRFLTACVRLVYFLDFMVLNTVVLLMDAIHRRKASEVPLERLERLVKTPSTEVVPAPEGDADSRPPVAIVTGANSGIGLENAYQLARAGMLVVLACRSEKRGREAEAALRVRLSKHDSKEKRRGNSDEETKTRRGNVRFMQCDLSSLESVRKFCDTVLKEKLRLKVLMTNGGVMATDFQVTADGFEQQFGIHHVGHAAMISHLLPLLKAEGPSRIVVVGSAAMWRGRVEPKKLFAQIHDQKKVDDISANGWGYNKYQAYRDAKTANLCFSTALGGQLDAYNTKLKTDRREDDGTALPTVSVCCYHPGCVTTNITSNSSLPFNSVIGENPVARSLQIKTDESASHGVHLSLDPKWDNAASNGKYFHLGEVHTDGWIEQTISNRAILDELVQCTAEVVAASK